MVRRGVMATGGATAMSAREAVTTSRPTAFVAESPGSSFSITNFGTFLLGGLGIN
jgi:hypothetical protein